MVWYNGVDLNPQRIADGSLVGSQIARIGVYVKIVPQWN